MEAAVSAFQQDGIEIHSCDTVACLEFVFNSLRHVVTSRGDFDAARDAAYQLGEAHGLSESEVRVLHILALSVK